MGTKTPDMQLLEACPEAMILISEGKPLAWNSMACRVLDWSSAEAGVDRIWDAQCGLWELQGDEEGLVSCQ